MSRTSLLLILLVVLIVGSGLWFAYRKGTTPSIPKVPKSGPIVFFGDSLVEGVGASEGGSLPALVEREVPVPVLNYGRSGDTTSQALERIEPALSEKPQLAIILLGGNDFLQRLPRSETEQNLRTIIEDFQKDGASVILLGVRGAILGDGESEKMFERIAKDEKVEYVSDVLSGLFGHRDLMSDPVHPNDAGYQKIAARLIPIVKKVLANNS